jgi:nitrogen fixation NifU-like protein
MDMYADIILEHYKHPLNHGKLDRFTVQREEYNPLCGDKIIMHLLIENNTIKDIRFSGTGCAISISATSMLTDFVKGKTLDEVKKLDRKDIMKMLGVEVNPARIKCALIGLKTLKLAVYDYLVKQNGKISQKEFGVDESETR